MSNQKLVSVGPVHDSKQETGLSESPFDGQNSEAVVGQKVEIIQTDEFFLSVAHYWPSDSLTRYIIIKPRASLLQTSILYMVYFWEV